MNILIVDDEAYSVAGIASSLNWDGLGIQEVYKAYSMQQAQKVFREEQVDLMICDIEMPKGSGIDLMEWVREQGFATVCIFLTCYSKFEYTSRAFKLQIFDYILKPAEYSLLEETVRRAVQKAAEDQENQRNQQQAEYWNEERAHIAKEFWVQLLTGSIPADSEKIRRTLRARHENETLADQAYYLALIHILPDRDSEQWSKDLLEYALSNIVSELLNTAIIPQVEQRRFVAVSGGGDYPSGDAFAEACKKTVLALRDILPAEFLAYYDAPCRMEQAASVYQGLLDDAKNNLSLESMVFRHGSVYTPDKLPEIPIERWQIALLGHNTDLILDEIEELLHPRGKNQIIDRTLLRLLYHNLLDVVYFVLDLHHLPAHQPFLEETSGLFEHALDSIPDFQVWAQELVEHTTELISSSQASSSLVETVRKYVREHLEGDLSRNALANVVHLNPDYLSSLFREKSGTSLTEFITQERLRSAKHLLLTTDLPVHEIAIRTGFQNISYFSKQFRRMEDLTPMQYRKRKES